MSIKFKMKPILLVLIMLFMSSMVFGATINIDGTKDAGFGTAIAGSDGKNIYITNDASNLYIGYESEALNQNNKAFYVMIDATPTAEMEVKM